MFWGIGFSDVKISVPPSILSWTVSTDRLGHRFLVCLIYTHKSEGGLTILPGEDNKEETRLMNLILKLSD